MAAPAEAETVTRREAVARTEKTGIVDQVFGRKEVRDKKPLPERLKNQIIPYMLPVDPEEDTAPRGRLPAVVGLVAIPALVVLGRQIPVRVVAAQRAEHIAVLAVPVL